MTNNKITRWRSPTEKRIEQLIAQYDISGSVSEGGPASRVYGASNRVFTVQLSCAGRSDTFAVYVGRLHPDIDLVFALWLLVDISTSAQEETYERWLAENGEDYRVKLGDEQARAIYEEYHEIHRKLGEVLGEQIYEELCTALYQ